MASDLRPAFSRLRFPAASKYWMKKIPIQGDFRRFPVAFYALAPCLNATSSDHLKTSWTCDAGSDWIGPIKPALVERSSRVFQLAPGTGRSLIFHFL
jgi:hypothetical protein